MVDHPQGKKTGGISNTVPFHRPHWPRPRRLPVILKLPDVVIHLPQLFLGVGFKKDATAWKRRGNLNL